VLEKHDLLRVKAFTLDATNDVPVTEQFLYSFGSQYEYPMSALAGMCYALVANHVGRTGEHYYAWVCGCVAWISSSHATAQDVLTAAYVIAPELFQFSERRVRVHVEPPSAGTRVLGQVSVFADV
jgi:purine nucleosidase